MQAIRDITGDGKLWPNARVMADAIGGDYETVRKWLQRGRIPSHAWPAIINKSAEAGRPVTADDLLAAHRPRKKRKKMRR